MFVHPEKHQRKNQSHLKKFPPLNNLEAEMMVVWLDGSRHEIEPDP